MPRSAQGKTRREMSDSLASKLVDKQPKIAKKNINSTITSPQEGQHTATMSVPKPTLQMFEIFPDFEDDNLVKLLTQIEQENETINTPADKQNENEVAIKENKGSKTINYSALTNISNINRNPILPHMYFPNSNVTINYNFPK